MLTDERSLTCQACGETHTANSLFCRRCTAPIHVASLSEFTESDDATCAGALLEILASFRAGENNHAVDRDLFLAYLNAFWLRPETAIILYAEAIAMRSLPQPDGPHLDLGCGDGIHAALYSGWQFQNTFDAFQSLQPGAKDIYNHFSPDDFAAPISRRGRKVEFGIDIKPTAIARANSLGIFDRTLTADATQLPLPDKSVTTIFSNMLRDLGDPLPAALDECRRVLRDVGRLRLSAMTPNYPQHLHFAPAARIAEQTGDIDRARNLLRLDRGRSVFCRRQLSPDQWNDLLAPHGLQIDGVVPIVGQHIMRLWDVGLRPFTRTLLQFREHWIESNQLATAKSGAIDLLDRILAPAMNQLNDGEISMHLLSIKKR